MTTTLLITAAEQAVLAQPQRTGMPTQPQRTNFQPAAGDAVNVGEQQDVGGVTAQAEQRSLFMTQQKQRRDERVL